MNDYETISNLELNSYKSIGSLNEDNLVAASDLSNAMSAICYNLSNMLDKRDLNSTVSGNVIISNDLSVNGKFAQGANTFASGQQSHAEGENTQALGAKSHAEGYNTIAQGWASHAEGADYTYAGGQKSHAEGGSTSAFGSCSHTEGRSTIARARYSHVEGACAESLCAEGFEDEYSYVWSGVYSANGNRYQSHGAGSFSINPKEGTNGFFIGDKSFTDHLSGLSGDLNSQIERKLDKYDGGIVSGDVAVFQHDMKILSGNYIQTNDDSLSVQNFSYKNAFLQAEIVADHTEWGIACTGSRGYCILSVNCAENKIKLSGDDISELASHLNEKYSWAFGSAGDCQSLEISSVDSENSIITLKSVMPIDLSGATSALTSEAEYVYRFEHDDNAFYCPARPDIGNTIIHNFYANHAEGGSVKAIGKYTHAEGRATIADMRYSHAEGDRTVAGRMAAHAEGQGTKAYGHYSHAEGYYTKTDNDAKAAHAEGQNTIANGEASHAEGHSSSTFSTAAHSEGHNTIAGARGYKCIDAKGTIVSNKLTLSSLPLNWKANDIVTIINNATAYDNCATISSIFHEGSNYKIQFNSNLPFSKIDNASNTFIINKTRMDNGNIDVGPYAHAEGNGSIATGNSAHAEGTNTKALNNQCHAEGGTTTASGKQAHAEGLLTLASGNQSHAEGLYTIASNAGAHAAGISAVAKDKYSYVWNGIDAEQLSSNGPGTFNIYPKDSTKGFYIGDQNLCSIISSQINQAENHASNAVNELKKQISSALSTIAADPLSSLTYSSNIDNVISAAVEMRNILSSLYDAMRG